MTDNGVDAEFPALIFQAGRNFYAMSVRWLGKEKMMRKLVWMVLLATAVPLMAARANCIVLQNYTSCIDAAGNRTTTNHIGNSYGGMTLTTGQDAEGTWRSDTETLGASPVYGVGGTAGTGLWAAPGTTTVIGNGFAPGGYGGVRVYANNYSAGNSAVITPGLTSTITCAPGACQPR